MIRRNRSLAFFVLAILALVFAACAPGAAPDAAAPAEEAAPPAAEG